MSTRLMNSTPYIIGAGSWLFEWEEIRLFENLILSDSGATELTASDFFDRLPKFLLMGKGPRLKREVVLIESKSGNRSRVDFFRDNYGHAFWDVIELKAPKGSAVSRAGSEHPRLSGLVFDAINQAQDYRDIIDGDAGLRSRLEAKGIKVYRPEVLIVAGRSDAALDATRMRDLYDRVHRTGIYFRTYDDVYRFAG